TGDGISAVRADFAVDLANGNYEVDVHIGFALHVDDINVIIEGGSNTFLPQANLVQTLPVTVSDGQMNLQFMGNFGLDTQARIAGIEIRSVQTFAGGSRSLIGPNVPAGDTRTDLALQQSIGESGDHRIDNDSDVQQYQPEVSRPADTLAGSQLLVGQPEQFKAWVVDLVTGKYDESDVDLAFRIRELALDELFGDKMSGVI
ncbi:MAG: hypothetical protein ACR2NP_03105, partial [Pirellulaceae bacterium]